jgi:hypothetical protein
MCLSSPHFRQLRHIHPNPQQAIASGLLVTTMLMRSPTSHIIKKITRNIGSRTSSVGVALVHTEGAGAGHGEAIQETIPRTKDTISHLPQRGGGMDGPQQHPLLPWRRQRRRKYRLPTPSLSPTRTTLKDTRPLRRAHTHHTHTHTQLHLRRHTLVPILTHIYTRPSRYHQY